ncbi:hypothetical protein [Micromonospora musae]
MVLVSRVEAVVLVSRVAAVVLVSPVGGSGRWRQAAAGVAGGNGE